jgi:hypothetical protein
LQAGDKVQLGLEARDETGAATPAWILGLVVDERVAPRQPALTAFFHLLSETRSDLENAELVVSQPATVASALDLFPAAGALMHGLEEAHRHLAWQELDLFLGTQGWRRFVKPGEDTVLALEKRGSKDTATAKGGRGPGDSSVLLSRQSQDPIRLAEQYKSAVKAAVADLRSSADEQLQRLAETREQNEQEARSALAALHGLEDSLHNAIRFGLGALVVVLLAGGAVFLVVGIARMVRQQAAARPALALALILVFSALVIYGVAGRGQGLEPNTDGELARLQDNQRQQQHKDTPALPEERQAARLMGRAGPAQDTGELFFARPTREAESEEKLAEGLRMMPSLATTALADDQFGFGGAGGHDPRTTKQNEGRASRELALIFRDAKQHQARLDDDGQTQGHPPKEAEVKKNLLSESTAHPRSYASPPQQARQDTLLWAPDLLLPGTGSTTVAFGLAQSGVRYQILLYANDPSGRLGVFRGVLQAR